MMMKLWIYENYIFELRRSRSRVRVPYKPEFSGFLFATAKVAYITAMIFLQIILHSPVGLYQNFKTERNITFQVSLNAILFPSRFTRKNWRKKKRKRTSDIMTKEKNFYTCTGVNWQQQTCWIRGNRQKKSIT